MITARLFGRMGNQMFQYAAARGLAARLGTEVALDTREVERRGEGLIAPLFNLRTVAPAKLPPDRKTAPLRYLAWRHSGAAPRFRREHGLGYNPAFEHFGDGSYLHGYWQSERYFAHAANEIRRDFAFAVPPSPENARMADRIGATLAVSLHVRRGDYVANETHAICDRRYYDRALGMLLPRLDAAPTVFVFSDDPAWVRDNLPLPCARVVVDLNGPEAGHEDMRLMSLCRHHIVANSSFSWWGAWLDPRPDKIVLGPNRWFANPKLANPDILPPDWQAVPVD